MERWTPLRKAKLVLAVKAGQLTEGEAIAAHGLSRDEFEEWKRRFAEGGRRSLSNKMLSWQRYRPRYRARVAPR